MDDSLCKNKKKIRYYHCKSELYILNSEKLGNPFILLERGVLHKLILFLIVFCMLLSLSNASIKPFVAASIVPAV